MLSDREKFIIASTIMVSTETAKKLDRTTRQGILSYIREKHCPTVTDDDWREISKGINEQKDMVLSTMINDYTMGDVQKDPTLARLDRSVRDNIKNVDVDSLKSEDKHLQKMIDDVKQKKSEMEL